MAKNWIKEGAEVTVITSPYEKSNITSKKIIRMDRIDGINLIIINFRDSNRFSILKRMLNAIFFSIFACYYIIKLKYDICIASSGPITVGIPMLFSKFFKKKKTVFEVRDLWPDGLFELKNVKNKLVIFIGLFFEKTIYDNSDLIVAASEGMSEQIRKKTNKKIVIVPNASDNKLFDSFNIYNSTKPYFIYAGSLGFMDDLDYLFDAIDSIDLKYRQKFDVLIFGDGVDLDRLQNISRKKKYNIIFKGLVSKNILIPYLKGALASFVLFKNYQILGTSSPNKMFDSFAAGISIIHNTEGWIKTLINKENCGFNVDPKCPNDLSELIVKILNQKIELDKINYNAKKIANKLFNRKKISNFFLNELKKI